MSSRVRKSRASSRSSGSQALERATARDRGRAAGSTRHQRVGVGGEAQRRAGARKLDDERAALDGGDAADTQLGVETVGEVVALPPEMQWSSVPSLPVFSL